MTSHRGGRLPAGYPFPQPPGMVQDLVLDLKAELDTGDERLWVPQAEGVSFRPLMFGVTQGCYANLLRVRRAGVLSCHRHFGQVFAYVLKGRWFYLEHEWEAVEGSFAMEPPGETHTLYVPEDVNEMITLFIVHGGYTYLDERGHPVGHEDVFTKLERCRAHYAEVGLADRVDALVR